VVEFGDQWSLTASHECLEMLADPFGRRMRAGRLLDQAIQLGLEPRRVRYLVEICDPSESGQFSYQINGVQVSDFYTPHSFDPIQAPGVRYGVTGALEAPRQVLEGGDISWKDPVSKHWLQVRMFLDQFSASVPHVLDLTEQTVFEQLKMAHSLRSAVHRVTKTPAYHEGLRGQARAAAQMGTETSVQAQVARAEELRQQIVGLRGSSVPER
jgi:hypothetical protein